MERFRLHHRLGIIAAAFAILACIVVIAELQASANPLMPATPAKKYLQLDAKGAPHLVASPTTALQTTLEIRAIAVNGNDIYVGGAFDSIGGIAARGIARFNLVSQKWFPLGADAQVGGNGVAGNVSTITIIGNDVYVAGAFTGGYNRLNQFVSANCVARWNTSTNTWAALGTGTGPQANGFNGDVYASLAVGGNLYFAGNFKRAYHTAANSVEVNAVAAWNPTTATWSSLGKGIGATVGYEVYDLGVIGNDLFVGGKFPAVYRADNSFIHVSCIARWNLVSKDWFALGVVSNSASTNGLGGDVHAITTDGTNLYVGGTFQEAHNSATDRPPARFVARWNGSAWSTLNNSNSQNNNGVDNNVLELCYDNGTLFVGGEFGNVQNTNGTLTPANRLARWNGTAWSMIGDGVGFSDDNSASVFCIGIAGGQLYAGGYFDQAFNNPTTPVNVPALARWTGTVWTTVGTVAVKSLAVTSAASFVANEAAADGIFSAFGGGMTAGTQTAGTIPLPTTLLNTTISVRDSAGTARTASLFFVSPNQINFLIPAQTLPGTAVVTINTADGSVFQGNINVLPVAPGLFTLNATGQGVMAAVALRVRGTTQTYESLARFDTTTNKWVTTPIDLGPTTDKVFLIAYGTGFRGRTSGMPMALTIGGTSVPVAFAGAQGSLSGLDQLNAEIPRSLIGRGEVDVIFTVNGKAANTVKINIK